MTGLFAYFFTRNRDCLLNNIFACFHLTPQRIVESLIQIGFRKLTFPSVCLTFGRECMYLIIFFMCERVVDERYIFSAIYVNFSWSLLAIPLK